jgi:hypothetical protein
MTKSGSLPLHYYHLAKYADLNSTILSFLKPAESSIYPTLYPAALIKKSTSIVSSLALFSFDSR